MLKQYLESVLPSDIVDNKLVELIALTAIFKANHKKTFRPFNLEDFVNWYKIMMLDVEQQT